MGVVHVGVFLEPTFATLGQILFSDHLPLNFLLKTHETFGGVSLALRGSAAFGAYFGGAAFLLIKKLECL